jgi:hypothetical protein
MTLLSRLLSRIAHLPPAETPQVLVERDLKAPMPDGVILLADRYAPRGVENPPLILVRSCYGRRGLAPDLPPVSEPDHYRYDPTNPTPSLAGPRLTGKAQTDNRALEFPPSLKLPPSLPPRLVLSHAPQTPGEF